MKDIEKTIEDVILSTYTIKEIEEMETEDLLFLIDLLYKSIKEESK